MIIAGFLLLAVGAVDLVRQFVPRQWIGHLVSLVVLLTVGSVSDALLPMVIGIIGGIAWAWTMRPDRDTRVGFWPAVVLALVVAVTVAILPARPDPGIVGRVWQLDSPFGPVAFDVALLVLGVVAFLLESSNLVVRAALAGEHTWRPADAGIAPVAPTPRADAAEATDRAATEPASPPSGNAFKGGRLIGPLERVIVFMLTLTAAYPILAAMLAAKGIVRFPEISKDGETGARAEYFLVGSLVSWVIALGAAFLVWWAVHA